jgi:hypothetical protein
MSYSLFSLFLINAGVSKSSCVFSISFSSSFDDSVLVLTALSIKLSVTFFVVGLPSKSLSGVFITGSLLCSSNHVAIIVTCTSSSILSSKLIPQIIFTSGSIISSITLAASCTSVGVRSVHHDTANIILFALSILVSNNGFSIAFLAASTALFSPAQ